MSNRDLKIAYCSHEAAKYAVEHWHYSRSMPGGVTDKIGVWEHGKFVGAVIFGKGINRSEKMPLGVDSRYSLELSRVALREHETPTSQIVSIAVRLLTRRRPHLKLLVSYADPVAGHVGVIYQAMNWVYIGTSSKTRGWRYAGKIVNNRTMTGRAWFGQQSIRSVVLPRKYKYIYPLTPELREMAESIRQPYPKSEPRITNNTPATMQEMGV